MDGDTTFASSSVRVHLVRGVVGLSLLVAAFALVPRFGPATLLLLPVAVIFLRGCPTCWALGLAQTRARERSLAGRSRLEPTAGGERGVDDAVTADQGHRLGVLDATGVGAAHGRTGAELAPGVDHRPGHPST